MFDWDWAGDIQGVLSTLPYLDTGCFTLHQSKPLYTHLGWEGGTGSLMWMTVFMLPVPFWLKSQTSCTLAPVSDIILATDNVVRLSQTVYNNHDCHLHFKLFMRCQFSS